MPEAKSKFLKELIDRGPERGEAKSFTSERQPAAQSFNLHVERRDGRQAEGFPWSHYSGYRWTDEGDHERLVVLFGMRAIEIEGVDLGGLVEEIREGQLNGIRELTSAQATLLARDNPDKEPVITSVKMYPDFDEILKEIKGEEKHETRFTRKFER